MVLFYKIKPLRRERRVGFVIFLRHFCFPSAPDLSAGAALFCFEINHLHSKKKKGGVVSIIGYIQVAKNKHSLLFAPLPVAKERPDPCTETISFNECNARLVQPGAQLCSQTLYTSALKNLSFRQQQVFRHHTQTQALFFTVEQQFHQKVLLPKLSCPISERRSIWGQLRIIKLYH